MVPETGGNSQLNREIQLRISELILLRTAPHTHTHTHTRTRTCVCLVEWVFLEFFLIPYHVGFRVCLQNISILYVIKTFVVLLILLCLLEHQLINT